MKKIVFIAILSLFTINIYSQTEKEVNNLETNELKEKYMKEYQDKYNEINSNLKLSKHAKEKLREKVDDEYFDKLNKLKPKSELPLKELEKEAENNDPEAQNALAQNYYNHYDREKAFKWFLKAAENNNAESQYIVSSIYLRGVEVKKDVQKRVYWLSKSAENGFARAQFYYSVCFIGGTFDGIKGNRDPSAERYWLQKSADQGYSRAQYFLGECYKSGQSTLSEEINVDKNKAFYWFQKAANNDRDFENKDYYYDGYDLRECNPMLEAQTELGIMYFKGIGTNVDIEKAIYWSTKSIEKINSGMTIDIGHSIINLGDIYFYLKDFDKALYWYNIGLKSYSDSTAKEKILEVEKEIALRKEEKNAISQGTEVANALYKKRQEEQNEKDRLEKQKNKEQEEYTKILEAMWAANAAKNNFSEEDVIPVDRSSFAKDLGKELNKTANTIKQQGAEYDARSRGTTVAEENAKAKRQAEFDASIEQNSNSSSSSSGSSLNNSSSGNTSDRKSNSNNSSSEIANAKSYIVDVNHIYTGTGKTEAEACENAKNNNPEQNITKIGDCKCKKITTWNDKVGTYVCEVVISAKVTTYSNPDAKINSQSSNTRSK